jgi:hypothetical protein
MLYIGTALVYPTFLQRLQKTQIQPKGQTIVAGLFDLFKKIKATHMESSEKSDNPGNDYFPGYFLYYNIYNRHFC